ncbi:lipopolysaccharide biosynthesis protein [Brevundimonas halotolerans]|uniref:O-antigen/teichoic acid export membrane protein n=1 Tax=Brevundimonas halotolerans TaxID=69670 RepID=A0A7W9A4R8_9CAUL|nr:oligosaccharide flippase family protein [Brevundimonas halotolerans]MBB5661407.1 O-antigen/teichoic acid export membrane protein [Brevundimonas halotolerans]
MSFLGNARIMLIGFAVAQALPLLAAPLLTRLFSPEAFGLQMLFISWATVVGVVATLRLDLATVLAADRREATHIVALAASMACAVALLLLGATTFFGGALAGVSGQAEQTRWMLALAPMVLAVATVQISAGLLTWLKRFGPASQAQVLNQAGYLTIALLVGFTAAPTDGLVFAKLGGQIAAALFLLVILRGDLATLRLPGRLAVGALWRRCRPFLMFNAPYSLVGVVGREVPIFAFSAVGATALAGHYGLARTLLGAPSTLLAASLSQVFYREAVELKGTPRLADLTVGVLRATIDASAPLFAFLLIWGDAAFAMAFGDEWRTAGQFAMILSVAAWLSLQTSWPERLFEAAERQGVSFAIQLGFDLTAAVAVFIAISSGAPGLVVVTTFAVVNSLFHLAYLTGMFHVSGVPLQRLVACLLRGAAIFAFAALALVALRLTAASLPALIGSGVAAAGVASVIALARLRELRAMIVSSL